VKYKDRVEQMATYIDKDSTILDLGAGSQDLKLFLPHGCVYIPVDKLKLGNNIVYDLNESLRSFPFIFDYNIDYVFCSGLLEYIQDLPKLFSTLHKMTKKVILSYAIREYYPGVKARRDCGWYTDFSREELIDFIKLNGFKIVKEDFSKKFKQAIFVIEGV